MARLGEDYAANARLIREALPDSLEQAEWLHDVESIRAVVALISAEAPASDRAIHALEAIGYPGSIPCIGQPDRPRNDSQPDASQGHWPTPPPAWLLN